MWKLKVEEGLDDGMVRTLLQYLHPGKTIYADHLREVWTFDEAVKDDLLYRICDTPFDHFCKYVMVEPMKIDPDVLYGT